MDAKTLKGLNKLVGAPFKDGARGPEAFDCWGVTMAAMKLFDYALPDYQISALDAISIDSEIGTTKHLWTQLETPEPGCVIIMRLGQTSLVNHIGVYVGDGLIVHTREKTGCIIHKLSRPCLQKLVAGFYRPPEEYKV